MKKIIRKVLNFANKKSLPKAETKKELNNKVEQGIRFAITTYGGVLKDLAQYDRGAKPRTR